MAISAGEEPSIGLKYCLFNLTGDLNDDCGGYVEFCDDGKQGGQYTVTGTIAQPDAAYSESGNYELLGGFWPGAPMCLVDFEDFAKFAKYWLESGTGLPADLYGDGTVDFLDLEKFVEEWLCYCPYGWPLK